jgi:hypothetical protein
MKMQIQIQIQKAKYLVPYGEGCQMTDPAVMAEDESDD